MRCDEIREQLPDFWTGAMEERERSLVEAHFESCAACRSEAEALGAIWKKLGALPEEKPTRELRARFEATLEAYMHGLRQAERGPSARERVDRWLEGWWPRQPVFQFGFAMVFMAMGLLAGYALTGGRQDRGEVARLQQEVRNTRQLVALSLMQQQSASERLKGVDWSVGISQPDSQVVSALLHAVNYDQNVNVRLAAIDALRPSARSDRVRRELLGSLERQTSPLAQIALIDLMVEIRNKEAGETLRELTGETDTNPEVKERAQWALAQLK